MGEAQRLGPMSANGRTLHEPGRIPSGAAHGGGQDWLARGRYGEQSVGSKESPTRVRCPGKPLHEGRPDPGELGGTSGDRDDRQTQLSMEQVEVQDIESADDRTVEEDGADTVERSQASNECDDPSRAVGTVDADPTGPDGFHMLRERERDRRNGGVPVVAVERSVIDPDHAGVDLAERTP